MSVLEKYSNGALLSVNTTAVAAGQCARTQQWSKGGGGVVLLLTPVQFGCAWTFSKFSIAAVMGGKRGTHHIEPLVETHAMTDEMR
jgi:hypothetical protein